MNNDVKQLINSAVLAILKNSSSVEKLGKLEYVHEQKLHFIPKRYRILGGILQSMNIQFGNFIEVLIAKLIANDERYEIVSRYSGKKSNNFELSLSNDRMIDAYITNCQGVDDFDPEIEFPKLLNKICFDKDVNTKKFKHDIDLLFRDKRTGTMYYLEIKYNDDHDTGKFVDINRKFIKTYAYLVRELHLTQSHQLVPILFFFNNKKMKGNIYIPEKTNIRRGKNFFQEFLNIQYQEVDNYLSSLSENDEIVSMFNKLYQQIMQN